MVTYDGHLFHLLMTKSVDDYQNSVDDSLNL